jgi:hypothetical protein
MLTYFTTSLQKLLLHANIDSTSFTKHSLYRLSIRISHTCYSSSHEATDSCSSSSLVLISAATLRHRFRQRLVPGCLVFRACFSLKLKDYMYEQRHLTKRTNISVTKSRANPRHRLHHRLDWNKSSHRIHANTPKNFPSSREPQFSNFLQESSTSTAFRRKATTYPHSESEDTR